MSKSAVADPVEEKKPKQSTMFDDDELLKLANKYSDLCIERAGINEKIKKLKEKIIEEMNAHKCASHDCKLKDGEVLNIAINSAMRTKKVVTK